MNSFGHLTFLALNPGPARAERFHKDSARDTLSSRSDSADLKHPQGVLSYFLGDRGRLESVTRPLGLSGHVIVPSRLLSRGPFCRSGVYRAPGTPGGLGATPSCGSTFRHLPAKALRTITQTTTGLCSNGWILEKRNGLIRERLTVHAGCDAEPQRLPGSKNSNRLPHRATGKEGLQPEGALRSKTGYESPVECRQVPAPYHFP